MTCEYYTNSDHPACPEPLAAHVQPRPIGSFAPVGLCIAHVFPHIDDNTNLGPDWSIVAVSSEAARALSQIR